MREKLAIIFAIILVCGLSQAQKPHKGDTNEFLRQELERFRALSQQEHERASLQAEQAQNYKTQLERLRAAVAKAARL